jgi:hypothetical protein
MPTPASDNPAAPDWSATPTIRAHAHLDTGCGFLPDHNVAIRITHAGEDISDYLAYVTDADGDIHCELLNSVTGTLYIHVTDHRPDPGGAGDGCGATPDTVVAGHPTRLRQSRSYAPLRRGWATLRQRVHSPDPVLAADLV